MKKDNQSSLLGRIALYASITALVVIVLGAYVRLSDAGLGCPDWPGCYGKIIAPTHVDAIQQANEAFPERPVEVGKAWKEMVHRYLASFLGLMIIALNVIAWRKSKTQATPRLLPFGLLVLVCFQGALGMWTVTLLLKPAVVTMHLLMGMTTLALLWWLTLRTYSLLPFKTVRVSKPLRYGAFFGLILLAGQIFLGGWTSTNYVALHCYDLPTCQGEWLPPTDFKEAFRLWREVGMNYEGGVLSNEAGVAIHLSHRIGALITFLALGALSLAVLFRVNDIAARAAASCVLVLLCTQVSLGILNIVLVLPIPVAVAHNGVAALLLLSLVTLLYALNYRPVKEISVSTPHTAGLVQTG